MSDRAHLPASTKAAFKAVADRRNEQDQETEWRKDKATDIISFNAGAEMHFVKWLKRKLKCSSTGSLSPGWIISNAAYELDVSTETIKRYLQKHTADLAPFRSTGKEISLRRKINVTDHD